MQAVEGVGETNHGHASVEAEAKAERVAWSALTVEHVAYAAVFAVGAAVRFGGLARMPLDTLEAVSSLAAWQWATGAAQPLDLRTASALLLHLQGLLFWLGANGDAAARTVSAAAGTLLVLTPWLMRNWLGRTTALVLALLFALDPWLVGFSRLADGAMFSTLLAVLGLALIASLSFGASSELVASEPQRRRDSILLAAVSGLYVTSGPMAWSYLPVLAAFTALNFARLRHAFIAEAATAVWFAGAFLLGATGWLTAPSHVGLISASLTTWVDSLLAPSLSPVDGTQNVVYGVAWPLRTLLADQPFVTLFGLAGLVFMAWRQKGAMYRTLRWQEVLWVWLAWGILLNLLPGRSPFTMLVLALPLLFGAAYLAARAVAIAPVGEQARETMTVVGTLLLLLFSAALWGASLTVSPSLDLLAFQALLLLLLLAAAILVFYGIWSGWRAAAWAGAVAFGLAILTVNIGATWRVNHWYDLGRPGGLFAESSDAGIRQLARDVQTLSAQQAGDAHELPVIIDRTAYDEGSDGAATGEGLQALLGWYLREMRRLQWSGDDGLGPSLAGDRLPVVISGAETEAVPAVLRGADYVGSLYDARQYSPPSPSGAAGEDAVQAAGLQAMRQRVERAWSERLQPWLRWALYRKGAPVQVTESLTLWAPRAE